MQAVRAVWHIQSLSVAQLSLPQYKEWKIIRFIGSAKNSTHVQDGSKVQNNIALAKTQKSSLIL